jgi:hypothetical protein
LSAWLDGARGRAAAPPALSQSGGKPDSPRLHEDQTIVSRPGGEPAKHDVTVVQGLSPITTPNSSAQAALSSSPNVDLAPSARGPPLAEQTAPASMTPGGIDALPTSTVEVASAVPWRSVAVAASLLGAVSFGLFMVVRGFGEEIREEPRAEPREEPGQEAGEEPPSPVDRQAASPRDTTVVSGPSPLVDAEGSSLPSADLRIGTAHAGREPASISATPRPLRKRPPVAARAHVDRASVEKKLKRLEERAAGKLSPPLERLATQIAADVAAGRYVEADERLDRALALVGR